MQPLRASLQARISPRCSSLVVSAVRRVRLADQKLLRQFSQCLEKSVSAERTRAGAARPRGATARRARGKARLGGGARRKRRELFLHLARAALRAFRRHVGVVSHQHFKSRAALGAFVLKQRHDNSPFSSFFQTHLLHDFLRGAETGERGLHQVHADECGEKEPVGIDPPAARARTRRPLRGLHC